MCGQTSGAIAHADGARSALDAATVFCHAGHDADHDKPVLPSHVQDAAVLQIGLAGTQHTALFACWSVLAPPALVRAMQTGALQPRAPPQGWRNAAASARGPPTPV